MRSLRTRRAYDANTTGAEFADTASDRPGVRLIDGTTLNGFGGFGGKLAVGGGLVFGSTIASQNPGSANSNSLTINIQ